ncbi:MAG: efflux RND transporter periplasmic adaptor subunit [Alphaproteobacteria bacterium]
MRDIAEAVGTARSNEAIAITAKVTGIVESINFADGQRVPAGTLLVTLRSDEAEASLSSAEAVRRNAELSLQRATSLSAANAIATARVDELKAQLDTARAAVAGAKARLADLKIYAPFSGTMGIRKVSPGAVVQPGTLIATLDDLSSMQVDFLLPETTLAAIKIGMPIIARSDAFLDRTFQGQVTAIDTRVDPVTRSIALKATLPNPDGVIRPGMFLKVEAAIASRENATLISEEALVPQGTKQYVFVVNNNKVERREVILGSRTLGKAEIIKGITPGEVVVIRGTQIIRDGSTVTVRGNNAGSRPAKQSPTS